jgi:hypothetical protein
MFLVDRSLYDWFINNDCYQSINRPLDSCKILGNFYSGAYKDKLWKEINKVINKLADHYHASY